MSQIRQRKDTIGGLAVSACASFTRASQTASWSTSTMTDEWHGCRILVHGYCCCVCGRYWSNVFHQDKALRRSRRVVSMRSANALESLLFVRSLAHTHVSVEATASSVSSPFGVRRACSGALVAVPGFFLEPDLLQLESHGSCERALLDWCSLGSHWPLHSLRLIERLLVQRVHCCRLVSHFDNLLKSSLLSTRSSVIRHVDNLFSSSLLNTLRCVVVWSTNCCAAELLLLPLLWGLCRLFHICLRIAYLRNFAVCCSRRLHQSWFRKLRRVHFWRRCHSVFRHFSRPCRSCRLF